MLGCELVGCVDHQVTLSANDCPIFAAKQDSRCILGVKLAKIRQSEEAQQSRDETQACGKHDQHLNTSTHAPQCKDSAAAWKGYAVDLHDVAKPAVAAAPYLAYVTHGRLLLVCKADTLMSSGHLICAVYSTTHCHLVINFHWNKSAAVLSQVGPAYDSSVITRRWVHL